jgi:hypothetical protein
MALESGQAEAAKLFARAADLSTVCATSHAKPNPEAQTVADKAGVRIEETARALAAGDKPQYQAWLWAADATIPLLVMTVTKTTRTRNIALAGRYTAQKLAGTDALRHKPRLSLLRSAQRVRRQHLAPREKVRMPRRSRGVRSAKTASGYYLSCFELFTSSRGVLSVDTYFWWRRRHGGSAVQDTSISSYSVTADVH